MKTALNLRFPITLMNEPPFKADTTDSRFSLTPFLAALQFLTVMPPLIKRPFTAQELGRSVGYYPLVGLLVGAVLAGANWLLGLIFPDTMRAALLLTVWVLLIGALHLDGFLDACDGLFGGWTPEKRLEIMRDHHIGAFALAGGVLLLLTKFTAITAVSSPTTALILAPVLGRWGISIALVRYPYARAQGLGRDMKDQVGKWELIVATGTAVLIVLLLNGLTGFIALFIVFITANGLATFVMRRIPGLTGDIYGAICEISELAVLLFFVLEAIIVWGS